LDDLRYPIGRFHPPGEITTEQHGAWIEEIEAAPALLRRATAGLDDGQLDTPYRPDGWTVRQVAHHLPDSHLNSYVRFKLALTENEPTIKPYDEGAWADLADSREPIEPSVALLENLHRRWVPLLRSLAPEDWERTYRHPEHGRTFTLGFTLGLYAWHGRHHATQIERLRERMGW
jgi:hypothetical protein